MIRDNCKTDSFLQFSYPASYGLPRPKSSRQVRARMIIAMLVFFVAYGAVAGRLVAYGVGSVSQAVGYSPAANSYPNIRPELLDRNGKILATDIRSASLFAEPRRISDPQATFHKLIAHIPELNTRRVLERLHSDAGFMWLKRQISPSLQSKIHDLGLPGIGFREEYRRFYPGGRLISHVVGSVDIDNEGLSGIELAIDRAGLSDLRQFGFIQDDAIEPVRLSIDARVQHSVRDELLAALERYSAKAAVGVVMDVHTGEVVSSVSLPDFDPNIRDENSIRNRFNRATAGVFEMGSVFKLFAIAGALDRGVVGLKDRFDTTSPIRFAGYTISDFHGQKRSLSVPEIFIHSSNIGSAKIVRAGGIERQQKFLSRLGLTKRLKIELPENATPLLPQKWNELAAMTISFGHGIAVSPLQTAAAAASLVNGGYFIEPTFYKSSPAQAKRDRQRVISSNTSDVMRQLLRLNVLEGSGRAANIPGYQVGGKTGTAEKIVEGGYSPDLKRNSFIAAFPMEAPRYIIFVMLDEPLPEPGMESATAGVNASPTTGAIIRRIAPLMGIFPDIGRDIEIVLDDIPDDKACDDERDCKLMRVANR